MCIRDRRDILGIKLKISTEWSLSCEDKINLVYSIRKASDFVYDYTDGYAMITSVHVWDGKRHWEDADVRVHNTNIFPQTLEEWFYPGWPKALISGYWVKRYSNATIAQKNSVHIMMPKSFGYLWKSYSIGDTQWGRTLGHEMGHYVFWLGDEYKDKSGKDYTDYTICYPVANTIICYPDENLTKKVPASVMNNENKFSELSTFKEYEEFRLMAEKQGVAIPKGIAKDLDEYTYRKLYNSTIIHEKPLLNALGESFKDILTYEKVKEIFQKM
jgi:hypothetical protein